MNLSLDQQKEIFYMSNSPGGGYILVLLSYPNSVFFFYSNFLEINMLYSSDNILGNNIFLMTAHCTQTIPSPTFAFVIGLFCINYLSSKTFSNRLIVPVNHYWFSLLSDKYTYHYQFTYSYSSIYIDSFLALAAASN